MAADKSVAQDLYSQSIAANLKAFEAGLYDVAYHLLSAALHSAKSLDSDQPLLEVERIATKQLEWIDLHHPEYEHSTQSANQRHNESIFANLARQAGTVVKMRNIDRKMSGAKKFGESD